ncbi:MAG: outer membrane protein assembly factor BamB family protein [Ktedonobacterales bacterium]
MVPDAVYGVVRFIASVAVVSALLAFLVTYLRRVTRHKGLVRAVSLIALACALLVLLFARSPLDYRASAPTGANLYLLSNTNDLYSLRATDGLRTFIRTLSTTANNGIVYHSDGLVILSYSGGAFTVSTTSAGSAYVTVTSMRAFRLADGAETLPALRALTNITGSTLDGGVLYVTSIDDLAHKDAETLHAFSLHDGMELWHSTLTNIAQSVIWGIDQGVLYIQLDNTVAAVRTGDGTLIWRSPSLTTASWRVEKFAPPRMAACMCS